MEGWGSGAVAINSSAVNRGIVSSKAVPAFSKGLLRRIRLEAAREPSSPHCLLRSEARISRPISIISVSGLYCQVRGKGLKQRQFVYKIVLDTHSQP